MGSIPTTRSSLHHNDIREDDAQKELQWLSTQLKTAQIKHESVLLTMHLPPGNNVYDNSNFSWPKEQKKFLNLIDIYQANIIGLLASHTHAQDNH